MSRGRHRELSNKAVTHFRRERRRPVEGLMTDASDAREQQDTAPAAARLYEAQKRCARAVFQFLREAPDLGAVAIATAERAARNG